MEQNEFFRSLLSGLAEALRLPEITASDDGTSSLLVIDDFEVLLTCMETEQILIFTVVAPLPAGSRQEIFKALLDANTFFYQTQGFTLAAREDTGVSLQGVMPLSVFTPDSFAAYVRNFLDVAEHWQQFCVADDGVQQSAPSSAPLPSDFLNMMNLRV
ncbi:MAG: type III secretion system chaperone [Mailhella sp.]|nr:type III secretion system chaperone [Mailhella sp.]